MCTWVTAVICEPRTCSAGAVMPDCLKDLINVLSQHAPFHFVQLKLLWVTLDFGVAYVRVVANGNGNISLSALAQV